MHGLQFYYYYYYYLVFHSMKMKSVTYSTKAVIINLQITSASFTKCSIFAWKLVHLLSSNVKWVPVSLGWTQAFVLTLLMTCLCVQSNKRLLGK